MMVTNVALEETRGGLKEVGPSPLGAGSLLPKFISDLSGEPMELRIYF